MNKIEIENSIAEIIKNDNGCETSFEYEKVPTIIHGDFGDNVVDREEVKAITLNPKTNESFLMFKTYGNTEIEALSIMLEYVTLHKTVYYSHTITWRNVNKSETTNTSYFYGKNALEALEKFYHGKNPNDYMVFNVKLNPMA